MAKFRKKPVEIEAYCFNQQRENFRPDWFQDRVSDNTIVTFTDHAIIHTLEGVMRASLGDWIILGTGGRMTDDEKLIEIMTKAMWINDCWLTKDTRDVIATNSLAAIRAAGWLLIPPLDTEEGQAAVEDMLSTWFDGESVEIIVSAIRAAGGSQ